MSQMRLSAFAVPDGGKTELTRDDDIERGDTLLVVFEGKDAYEWPQSSGDDHAGDPYNVPDQFERSINKPTIGNFGTGWNFEADATDDNKNVRYNKYAISNVVPVLQTSSGVLRERGDDVEFSVRLQWHEYPVRVYRVD